MFLHIFCISFFLICLAKEVKECFHSFIDDIYAAHINVCNIKKCIYHLAHLFEILVAYETCLLIAIYKLF